MGNAQALALEHFLAGRGFAKKPNGVLLSGSGARLLRACDLAASVTRTGSALPTCSPLDALLGGLPDSKLVEIVGRRSCGRFSVALAALVSVTSTGQDAALIDLGDGLDPQAAEQAGVDLTRLLWARPRKLRQALAVAEMLLAAGFRLVVAEMGLSPRGGRYIPDAAWVRLSRAVAAQGSTLLLLTPWRMSGIAADAVVSASGARPIWSGNGRSPRLLSGMTSRWALEKLGRETPGHAATMALSVAEAIPGAGTPLVAHRNVRIEEDHFGCAPR